MYQNILSILFIFTTLPPVNSGPLLNAENFLTEFLSLTSAEANVMDVLATMSDNNEKFLRKLGLVETEEMQALIKLHSTIIPKFSLLSDLKRNLSFQYSWPTKNYGLTLEPPYFWYDYDRNGPYPDKYWFKENFLMLCEHFSSPMTKLEELYLKVDLSCDLPTYEQTSIYAELFSLFKEIDDQVGDYRTFSGQNYHYDPFRSKVMGQLTRMPYKAASKVIQAIRKSRLAILKTNDDYKAVLTEVFPIKNHLYSLAKVAGKMREALKIHMYVAENFRCALKALIEDNFYETNALLKASRHIQINLVQLEIVAGLCAFNAANNSAEAIELEFSHINDMVVSIVNKMQKWIPLQLNMTWPSITTVAAKTSIYEQEEINPSSYNKVADRVKSAVDKVGFPGYDHQVVIWSNNVQFGAKCPSDSCINIVDYKNINALIVRSRETSPFNASLQISQWLHNNGEKVTQILNDNVSNGNLTYILHQVNTTMKDVVNKTMFRAALIIKNQNLLASKTIINIGEDSFKEWINSTKNTVDYFYNGYVWATRFKLVFFA